MAYKYFTIITKNYNNKNLINKLILNHRKQQNKYLRTVVKKVFRCIKHRMEDVLWQAIMER